MSLSLGNKCESLARSYLESKGLKFIKANYNLKFGEIDLIMRDKDILVFIEVKYRKNNKFMEALETITYAKKQKIKKVASFFIQNHTQFRENICRFDVITLCGNMDGLEYFWIKDAFY